MALKDTQKLYKVFRLIRLLHTPPAKDAKQLMRKMDISKSHLYRLRDLLKELDYKIKKDEQNRWYIPAIVSEYGNKQLSDEEYTHLEMVLRQVSSNNPLTTAILNKFNASLSLIPLVDSLPFQHANRIIQQIRIAINQNCCLLLKDYHSMTSGSRKNRLIEPLELTEDYRYLIGWEPKIDRQGQFKISRINEVEVCFDQPIQSGRTATSLDIFGLSSDKLDTWLNVKLELSSFAHYMLVEEFPLSNRYIHAHKKPAIFEGRVRNWKGIGRFVLGMPDEINVISPPEFKTYLKEKITKSKIFPKKHFPNIGE